MKLTSDTEGRLVDFEGCLERQPFWVGCMKAYERNGIPAVDEKTQEQRVSQGQWDYTNGCCFLFCKIHSQSIMN